MEKALKSKPDKWGNTHVGGHDLEIMVDLNEKMLVWRRTCSGYTKVGGELQSQCPTSRSRGTSDA